MPKQLPVLPRAGDVCSSTDSAQLLVPRTRPMAGTHVLAALVRVAEGPIGVPVSTQVVKHTAGGIFKVLRQQSYPEEPQLMNIPQAPPCSPTDVPEASFRSPEDFVVVGSADAATRVAAALGTLSGHPGAEAAAAAASEAAAKPRPTIMDYHNSYKAGVITPSAVAERVIKFLEAHNAKNHWLSAWSAQHIREAAAAATERFAAGKPLSVLDGVPFVVKDCIDALPYETSFGTRFMGQLHPVKAEAPGVAVLKELGAVLLGKTNMNEFGCLATGHNTHLGSARNPHNPDKATGGSSTGSAAAVAAGLCPFALGTDGGGSIRIPASLCGVMGLKTTKGRLADDHGAHSCFSSLTVTGPIATTAADLLLVYAALANIDYPQKGPSTPASRCGTQVSSSRKLKKGADAAVAAAAALAAPPLQPLELPRQLLPGLSYVQEQQLQQQAVNSSLPAGWKPLAGMSFGICRQWYMLCEPGVLAAVDKAAEGLFKLGAALVDLQIPELDLLQVAHSAVFAAECYFDAGQAGWRKDKLLRKQLNLDSRMFFANAGMFRDADYTAALRIRARARSHFERAFKQCNVIITPATPTTAPAFTPAVHTSGVYDVAKTFEAIRFTQAASLLGLPALVLPAGCVEEDGMPVGIQLIGQPFAEALLLKVAAALETRTQQVLPAAVLLPPLGAAAAACSSSSGSSAALPADGISTPGREQLLPQQHQKAVVIKAQVGQDQKLKKGEQQQQQPAVAAAGRSWLPRLVGSRWGAAAGTALAGSKMAAAVKAV